MGRIECTELAKIIARYSKSEGENATPISGVTFFKASTIEAPLPSVYEPCLCIIAQGSKEVSLGEESFRYRPSQYLAVGMDLPILNRILKASPSEPYLLMKVAINLQQVSELLILGAGHKQKSSKPERAIFVEEVDQRMFDCALRLAQMLDTPEDIPILAEQTLRELFYHVIQGKHGFHFAQIALYGSNTQRIAGAIRKIKSEFNKPLSIEELAESVGMSVSAFHSNFKSVTEMSPLQFQKKLRLIEARNLMSTKGLDAARTAYAVGYESASQFSREYTRMFGYPPMKDIARLKASQLKVAN